MTRANSPELPYPVEMAELPEPLPPELRTLVGVSEIATLLGVGRGRADQLTRTREFPAAIEQVVALDDLTRRAMALVFEQLGASVSQELAVELIEGRAYTLPQHPRLWRLSAVIEWAEASGRTVDLAALLDGRRR